MFNSQIGIFCLFGIIVLPIDCKRLSDAESSRIVGGEATLIQNIPWQAALLHFKVHLCGATILNEFVIITAAHCTEKIKTPKSLSVRVGSSYRGRDGKIIPVKRFLNHPKYDTETNDNDIAIIWLQEKLEFNSKIQPVKLPNQNAIIPKNTKAIASGWGKLFENGLKPEILHFVEVPVWSYDECKQIYKNELTSNMLCAGPKEGGKDACQQDSGGPLVTEGILIGVISWAKGCGRPNSPGVYANVAVFREWIDEESKIY